VLRSLVVALGVVCVGGGLVAFTGAGWPGGIGPTIFGALLILGTVFERLIYKQVEPGRPGPGWVATDERFVDEDNGKMVRVWLEPTSGERRYVRD
jgi:hypothetical protein